MYRNISGIVWHMYKSRRYVYEQVNNWQCYWDSNKLAAYVSKTLWWKYRNGKKGLYVDGDERKDLINERKRYLRYLL